MVFNLDVIFEQCKIENTILTIITIFKHRFRQKIHNQKQRNKCVMFPRLQSNNQIFNKQLTNFKTFILLLKF